MPTLAVFQLYNGVNKFYANLRHLDYIRINVKIHM